MSLFGNHEAGIQDNPQTIYFTKLHPLTVSAPRNKPSNNASPTELACTTAKPKTPRNTDHQLHHLPPRRKLTFKFETKNLWQDLKMTGELFCSDIVLASSAALAVLLSFLLCADKVSECSSVERK